MPADVPVSLTPWFDAKDNPPKDDKIVVTGSAYGYYDRGGWWQHYDDYGPDPMDPQPSVWCDPSPPDMNDPLGPLTVEDLHVLATPANRDAARWLASVNRLRRALDKISTP